MILANDFSDQFARSLVAATPSRGLTNPKRKPIYGVDPKALRAMNAARDALLAEAIPAFAGYARNVLDLVAAEAFARRLNGMPVIAAWIERERKPAAQMLASV